MSLYYREQKHICGKDYATAGYMEVDLYPVTPKQHKASRRAKKKEACTLAQQTYNDNRSKRYHVQLVNANFGKGDFSWTGTYDDDHLPAPGDTKRADMDWTNYIKRVYRWCDKNGVERPKWVAATEYTTVMADGTICGRHHHHAIIQHTEGLTRDVLEELWSDKNGNSIGLIFKSITFDNGSEFSAAEELERSAVNKTIPRTKVYFCHPYSSWERGSNENANSMIRRRHPKGTDFSKVSAAEIAATEEWINNYPRKIFGYKSSEVMFRECLREIGLIA